MHPKGRLVVVGFADPALPGGGQGLDEWLLDTIELPTRSHGSDSFAAW